MAAPPLVNPFLVNLFLDNPLPLTVLLAQPLIPMPALYPVLLLRSLVLFWL
ncbi:hypothetical protein [Streptomyces sp. NPDC101393]|uniref:hypothetical protein n=1 Tax=Streptomyces sp. NPDC101393 TaxID=3366141 RepID=UPI00381E4998